GDRKRTRLLQRAQLKYPSATLEDASFEGIRGIDRAALWGPALATWIERGVTICFAGATGGGKTGWACALALSACRQGASALYLRVPRLAEELRILHGAGSFRRGLQQLA
ncbi:ATP-binding protein, partial [Roseateles sp. BYS78W]